MKLKVDGLGMETSKFNLTMPDEVGEYQLVAELDKVDGKTVRSLRDIKVVRGNLALGKSVTASTGQDLEQQYHPDNAVDGNMGTRWSSAFVDPQWFQVDLGLTFLIYVVVIIVGKYNIPL